jgi:hypothetical protein
MPTTHQIREAFAALRIGCDFASAAELSRIPAEELMRLWNERESESALLKRKTRSVATPG